MNKFAQSTQRGAAGESAFGSKKAYNFSNLYGMNRADDEIRRDLSNMQGQAQNINRNAQVASSDAQRNAHIGQNQMAVQVQNAKNLANKAQNYDVNANAMKAGNSAYQSGIAGFYAGGNNNQSVQKIRKFGGIYQNILNQQSQMMAGLNSGKPNTTIKPPQKPPMSQADRDQSAIDRQNEKQSRSAHTAGHDMRNLSNLDWMLKTGRISNQEYYRARKDDAFYQQLLKQHS